MTGSAVKHPEERASALEFQWDFVARLIKYMTGSALKLQLRAGRCTHGLVFNLGELGEVQERVAS